MIATMVLNHSHSIAGRGAKAHEFRERLVGIAVDEQDRLLAAGDHEIKRFLPTGQLDTRFPVPAIAWSVTVADASIWVGRQGGIDQFDSNGQLQRRIDQPRRLGIITALAVHGDTIVAADATNRTIHLFVQQKWQREVGQDVNTRGFMLPNGMLDLALDAGGKSFVVAHPQKHRVERYTLDGQLSDKFGRFGMLDPADFGGCCNPTNITTSGQGLIAVSEKAPPRVKLYSPQGAYLGSTGEGVFHENAKNIDLAWDRQGRLYATDSQRCSIEVFETGELFSWNRVGDHAMTEHRNL